MKQIIVNLMKDMGHDGTMSASHVTPHPSPLPQGAREKRAAFTLAEILITLGIIGVVAAITLPSVIDNIQDMQYKVAAKKVYAEMAQIVEKMRYDGYDLREFRGRGGSFCPVLSKYYETECANNIACDFINIRSKYFTLDKRTKVMYDRLDDGMFITKDKRVYFCENPGATSNVWVTVDINGVMKSPNVLGRDMYTFWIDNNGFLKPMGTPDSVYPAESYCVHTLHGAEYQGYGCMYNVINNIKY